MTPESPSMKATGTNTAHSTSTIATTGEVTSFMDSIAASFEPIFRSRMMRSVFSSTTIASSTTIPMARMSPKRVIMLMVNPSMAIPAKVPMIEIGTAIMGMMVARTLPRKMKTTHSTRIRASMKV
ncbi:MAG: hypothetical protein BWY82_00927 [Verrucomicrobia bacterium ADurb.Bin474]|nr:MAG: hypothetical protein BWY82_00927 [Verrucomicrobia bacterium ADurb.Bin474]